MALQLLRASLILFLFSFILQTVYCLRCYTCSEPPDEGCGKDFSSSDVTLGLCGEKQNVCIKATGSLNGVKAFARACGIKTVDTDQCLEVMKAYEAAGLSDSSCSTCTTDACNSSSTIPTTFSFLLLTALVLYKIV